METSIERALNATSANISVGIGIGMLILAFIYTLADYGSCFPKMNFVGSYVNPLWYALSYLFSYVKLFFKSLIVLLFIFVFIFVYYMAAVGVLKPFVSENVDSSASIQSFTGADEIVQKAKASYFDTIAPVAKKAMAFSFGFLQLPITLATLVVLIPLFLLVSAVVYYSSFSRKRTIPDGAEQNILETNYHVFMIMIFAMLIMSCLFFVYAAYLQ
jgi:hypothetical protein